MFNRYFFHYLERDHPKIYYGMIDSIAIVVILAVVGIALYYLFKYTSTQVKYYILYSILGAIGVYGLYILYRETRPGWRQRADGVWVGSSKKRA